MCLGIFFDKKIRSGELRLQGNFDANPFPGHKGKAWEYKGIPGAFLSKD